MAEHDDVVSVADVSESSATAIGVSESTVASDETLMAHLGCEDRIGGSSCGEDGGEIMVEVVGSDVFVDGVGGQGGGGEWTGKEGGGGMVKEFLKKEIRSVDGEGGAVGYLGSLEVGALGDQVLEAGIETQVDDFQKISSSTDEQSGNSGGDIDSHGSMILHNNTQNSGTETGMGGSLVTSISSRQQREVVDGSVMITVTEERLEGGLVEEGVEKVVKSVERGSAAAKDMHSHGGVALDDELLNQEIGSSFSSPSTVTQSFTMQAPLVEEEVALMVNIEDEASVIDVEEGGFNCTENGHSSVAGCGDYVDRDKKRAIHSNAESLNESVEAVTGGEVAVMNEEDISHPHGNSFGLVEDQRMKAVEAGENRSQGDLHSDLVSYSKPTMSFDNKVSLNPDVGTPKDAGEDGADAGSGDDAIVHADSGSSIDKAEVAADYLVADDKKIPFSSDLSEPLSSENRVLGSASDGKLNCVKDQELKAKSVDEGSERDAVVCAEPQSSYAQTKVVNSKEVSVNSKGSDSTVEVPTTGDTDMFGAGSEGDMNREFETCGISKTDSHVVTDLESSKEQACLTEIGEIGSMDIEGVLNADGSCSGKDQYLEVKKGDESCENDTAKATMEGDKKLSDHKIEVFNGGTCLQKGEVSDTLVAGENKEKDHIAQGYTVASGGQIEIHNQVESSVLECQGIVQVPASLTFADNMSLSVQDPVSKNSIEDPSVGIDSTPIGDPSSSVRTCSDSLEDSTSLQNEKRETMAQLADIHAHVDGDQSRDMLIVDETLAVCGLAVSNTVIEGAAAFQTELDCDSTRDDVPVSSPVSGFMGLLPYENKKSEVHKVSSEFSLLNESQTIATYVSHPVNSDELMNPEAKVEFNNADEHCPEEQLLNKSMMGSLFVDLSCFNKDGKWKPQDQCVIDNVSLPDESPFTTDDVQAMEGCGGLELSQCLNGSDTGGVCLDDSSLGREVEVQEQYADAEQVSLSGGEDIKNGEQVDDDEQARHVDDESSRQTTTMPGSFAKGHQENYLLPLENEGEFSVSDLVWGKVRSHPWWPGQIFDPANASEKAMKYHKKDNFLVAYFGDRTFAWVEASLLKPFWTNFSQIEKQSNSEAFQNAVSCALEEVSRRVELGLACSCIPKHAYDKIESQNVESTGICHESSRRYGVDKYTGANSFEPGKLVEYISALAQSPRAGADGLELVIAKAQLLAINRVKGYCCLPKFQSCGGLLENNADNSQLADVIDRVSNDNQTFASKGRLKTENSSCHKRKHNLKDIVYPWKKERCLSELMGDVASSPDGEDRSDWKASEKSFSPSFGKKRKAVDSHSDGSEVQERISIYAAKVSTTTSPILKPSFKVGECISRVASQLTGSPSILKSSSGKFQKVDGSSDVPVRSDVSLQNPDNSPKKMIFPTEYSSLDEMLSELHSTAQAPMKGSHFSSPIITFFSGFRNSISFGQYTGRQNSSMGKQGGGRKKRAPHVPEEFDFDDVNDSYWTDRIIQNYSGEQPSGNGPNTEGIYQIVAFEPDKSIKSSRRSYPRKRFSTGHYEMAIEEPSGCVDERKPDKSPAELILNFTEGDYIPSEMNLCKIFRRFGPLKESDTEVDLETSRARVIFKRCSDAEVAFSSATKFNIFGPMIVNYQLSYSPSFPFKTFPLATLEQEDAA